MSMPAPSRILGVTAWVALGWLAPLGLCADDRTPASKPAPRENRPVSSEGAVDGVLRSLANRWLGQAAKPEVDESRVAFETAKGSSAVALQKQAAAELPLDKLTEAKRTEVRAILDNVCYYRRLPTLTIPVEPDVYLYFMRNPEVAVSLWRAMNISKLDLDRESDTIFVGDTNDGTSGRLEVLHRGERQGDVEQCLVLCDGLYKNALLPKPISARSLLRMETRFYRETNGQVYATHRADLFVSFPSETVEAVSRMMSPVTIMLTDRTFCEVTLFLKLMSAAMGKRPDWVEHLVEKMAGVPEERETELLQLTAKMYVAHNRDIIAKALQPRPVLDDDAEPTPQAATTVPTATVPTSVVPTAASGPPRVAESPREPVRK
jgi:hypothetical protein